ncbi:cysteine desulfurase [Dinoroseobacter shibae DFL 12 = DSM 16493]|uniref:Cysteine desulfurase n=1 Tax=Dinoroseobacter shibae (strain DSM 16493 / NCIMB 14021 / DFL 12) TaxID=398580 RepID=A8LL10_DINSH|nr:aminotransferase class V-fold PLP-dependent enzyme [Dinoroseobacter shibae]ABV93374.1 cysteine desulfurase [Dinoroseobacter shibae DFL 12 = DSM 16493]URF48543.1 aminotransferase class V-fold PLP-dependent enzyme [Dinoroseobacter shibae]URF52857.1 aminotransferase class V-fold PLP-dependent enzyme [Dinoroseobacter shibae]
MKSRVYLDHNATAPLRTEARTAICAAMDLVGNPSSVHGEGRAAKALIERARAEILEALGAQDCDLVFTSGATEAAALACAGQDLDCAPIEHDAVAFWANPGLGVDADGTVKVETAGRTALQMANSETGIVQDLPQGLAVSDLTQAFGKLPVAFSWTGARIGFVSAHKLGGPKGIGAVVMRRGVDLLAQIRGGGQEMGWRSGTENLIGIAGFAAAAKSAQADLDKGVWARVSEIRNILETALHSASSQTIFVGKDVQRLPNTICAVTPGWRGETQVMQMDLAGFAVSAGSACSSGKVRPSRVLQAMGFSPEDAACALRVSIGPETKEEDALRFAEAWGKAKNRHAARAA